MIKLWRSALLVLISAAMLLASAPLAMAGNEFGALYIGNYDDYDADVFRSRMKSIGWTEELWKTSNSSIRSRKPAHFHFTDGIDGRLTEAGDDCDLLYISGHGWRRAKFPIYWNKGASSPYDSISADSNCVGGPSVHPWEVGVDWSGKYPSNQSRWDYDIEWAIFAACSQLDYRTSSDRLAYSNSWPRNSSAKTWARTLLGEPGRMHAILGYWDTAPAGTTDVAVMREFLYQAIDKDATVGDAWARANGKYGLPWAFVTHAENRNDRLHGQGPGATPDTNPKAAYHIDYYRSGVVARMLDGRGGSYEQLSDASGSFLGEVLARASQLLGVGRADASRRPTGVRNGRVHMGLRPSVPRDVPVVSELEPWRGTPSAIARAFGGTEATSATAHVALTGEIEYSAGRGVGEKPVRRPMQHAVALARDAVRELGSEFEDATVVEVRAVTRSSLDLERDAVDPEEVLQYVVSFAQEVGELYVDGPGVGLEVEVDGDGVARAVGCWFAASPARVNGRRTPMSAEMALSRRSNPESSLKLPEGRREVRSADLVLHVDVGDGGAARTAWRYEMDEGVEFYSDAISGAALD